MKFKDWLNSVGEVSTNTGDVAVFARPIFSGNWRMFPPPITQKIGNDDERKECKKDMQKL
jgi:hypothetical protein